MYNYFIFWFLLALGPLNEVQGQTDFGGAANSLAHAQWEEKTIADGIVWKYGQFGNLFDSRQSITIFEVDLSKDHIQVAVPHLESGFAKTSEFGEGIGAVAAINGSFFNTKTGGSVVFLKSHDSIYTPTPGKARDYRENAGFAMDREGRVAIVKRPDQGWETLVHYASILASGPMLLHGDVAIKQKEEAFNTNRHPRTAIGLTADHRLLAVVVDGRNPNAHGMSMGELAHLMESLGCVQAMNLDGGGSSTAWIQEHGVVNNPSDNKLFDHWGERPVANAICFMVGPKP